MSRKVHVVTVRFNDEEYEFLNNSVDYYYSDNLSDVLRLLVRKAMKLEAEDLK